MLFFRDGLKKGVVGVKLAGRLSSNEQYWRLSAECPQDFWPITRLRAT